VINPNAQNVERILERTPFGCEVVGTQVRMTLGPKVCMLDYATAIQLATMLNWCGRKAKSIAGDGSMHFLGIARLTDANADELEAQFNRDRTAVFAKVR
jgi:hypothetical protein